MASGATLTLAVGGPQGWTAANLNALLQSGSFSQGSSLGVDTDGGSLSLAPTISSSAGLTITGSNSLTLTGSNVLSGAVFSGATNICQGTLQLASSAVLLNSTLAIDSDNGLQVQREYRHFLPWRSFGW